jgi:hypothetical protein
LRRFSSPKFRIPHSAIRNSPEVLVILETVIAALIQVESHGLATAVGDGGLSLGLLQIQAGVVEDVNRIYGAHYKDEDALIPWKAVLICKLYLRHYCGSNATAEQYARTWNGGPNGPAKRSTLAHWEKVNAVLSEFASAPSAPFCGNSSPSLHSGFRSQVSSLKKKGVPS